YLKSVLSLSSSNHPDSKINLPRQHPSSEVFLSAVSLSTIQNSATTIWETPLFGHRSSTSIATNMPIRLLLQYNINWAESLLVIKAVVWHSGSYVLDISAIHEAVLTGSYGCRYPHL